MARLPKPRLPFRRRTPDEAGAGGGGPTPPGGVEQEPSRVEEELSRVEGETSGIEHGEGEREPAGIEGQPVQTPGGDSGVGRRLQDARYMIGDLLFVLGRIPRAIASGFAGFWGSLGVQSRQRLLLAILGGVAVALLLFVVVPALPCQVPGGERCPPEDDAAEIVPAGTLAYAHLNADPDTDQYEDAAELAERVPKLSQQVVGRLLSQMPGPRGAPPNFARDIESWFGGEAAVAVLPKGRVSEQVRLLEASDSEGALAFGEEISSGTPTVEEYQGVDIRVDNRGLATALVGGFLVIADSESAVRAIVDVGAGEEARSLATDEIATEIRDRLPDHRIAEVYLSRDGVADYVAERGASLSTLEPFVNARATGGSAMALVAGSGDLELAIRSSLDPERSRAQPGFFGALPGFEPTLAEKLDDDTLGYVGIGDPELAVKRLLTQASADAPGIAAGFADLSDELRDLGKVDVEKDLLPSLGGEAAFSLQPGRRQRGEAPSTRDAAPVPGIESGPPPSAGAPVPFLSALVDGVDTEAAKDALARLQGPIAEALKQSSTQAPVFNREEVEGVIAQSLRVSPTVNLTYALLDSLLVVATDPQGVAEVAAEEGGLSDSDRFELVTEELTDEDPSLLVYFNLAELVRLGELEGLSESPSYAEFAQELRRMLALGLAVRSSEAELDTDARVTVGAPPEEPEEAPQAPAPTEPASE